ncbi:MAG: flagellin, partial [SAR324 cluster bacterium]|nr:flagellin [SAR324 cluster bacterium]
AQNDLLTEDAKVTPRSIRVFQKNTLKPNLNFMKIAHENVLSRESVIKEAVTATKMAKFTRNQILMNSHVTMFARASQPPMAMLQLFNE